MTKKYRTMVKKSEYCKCHLAVMSQFLGKLSLSTGLRPDPPCTRLILKFTLSPATMHVYAAQILAAVTLLVQALAEVQDTTPAAKNTTACLLPKVVGPCEAAFPKYYYDQNTQACQKFVYGGCKGNDNNFESMEECEKTCWRIKNDVIFIILVSNLQSFDLELFVFHLTEVPEICRMKPDPGLCLAYMNRFAFNLTTMNCENFIYGGCGGNANNFKDEASCLETCTPKTSE
ncbi:thrombin inhibitor hemalin-like [Leptodactylus fuscus]|uniref:thrombin inhibitor hemalin-like n=1 Tax=Leptodactylus fuscus TaxID=238119 RepID=UPI003F4EC9EF